MSNENMMAPPLDVDLGSLDISMPLIADGIYDLRIEKADIKPTKDGKARMASLELATTSPARSQKGDADLNPGVKVFDNIMLAPTGKSNWEMVMRNMAAVVQAAGVQGAKPTNPEFWVPQLLGRIVRCKVGFEPEGVGRDGKQHRAKNVIALYIKQGA